MRRRLLKFLLPACAVLAIALALLPFWLGGAVAAGARSRGLTFARYERIGYSRFALHDVEYRRLNVVVTSSRVELDTPVVWLWRHTFGRTERASVGTWRVTVSPSDRPATPSVDRGWVWLHGLLGKIANGLDRWLPQATTGAGSVHWPGGQVGLGAATWERRSLAAKAVDFRGVVGDVVVSFDSQGMIRARAEAFEGQAKAHLETSGAPVRGDLSWWDQPLRLEAEYAPRGWLPASAVITMNDWSVPGERLKLGLYTDVKARGRLDWKVDRFALELNARGTPSSAPSVPPLEVDLKGSGDTRSVSIDAARGLLPGIEALLSSPIHIAKGQGLRDSPARFTVKADLAKVPWFSAQGLVSGEARVVPGGEGVPVIEFSAQAQDVTARDLNVGAVESRGRLAWPNLEITTATLTGKNGERLEAKGGWDFRRREVVGAHVEGELRRATVARWLPAQPTFDRVTVQADAHGAPANLVHEGRLGIASFGLAGIRPLEVGLEWKGHAGSIETARVRASAGDSVLTGEGSAAADGVSLTALALTQRGAELLTLEAPARIQWRPQVAITNLRLRGPEAALAANLRWGETGEIAVDARQVRSQWLADFFSLPGPVWTLSEASWRGKWERGPMSFNLKAGARLELGEDRGAELSVSARGAVDGVWIDSLRATEGGEPVVDASGRLPLQLTPGRSPVYQLADDGPLALKARVAPNAAFWPKLATATGVELKDPRVEAEIAGTWKRPQGRASLSATRIVVDPKRVPRPLPAIERLEVEVAGDRSGVNLSKFNLAVEGQPVQAQGRLPLPEDRWSDLFRDPLAVARRGADLRLEVPDAEVSAFTRFLPSVLAPKGRIEADLRYSESGFNGYVRIREAASRPLGPLGVLQEVNAEASLAGRTVTLKGVTAKSGGQPVVLSGDVTLPEGGGPRFNLALRGENLPFVRQTGLLLRGDLDLRLQTVDDVAGRLSGTVRLRDSLFLSDVRDFLPKGGASARRRPPYFSIETPPMNGWQLAIDVTGEKFLRLRTPVFAGLASARFRLGGTLGEPRAVGEASIDEGTIRMPFASFTVTQGTVRLTEADPYEPAVYVRGTGRRYGYDLTMEVDGKAAEPEIIFTSSPALESEQVLLMVMTGAAPRNEIANTATQRAANVGLFLGQSLLSSLGSDAADADRLSFASGEKISRQGKETYDIEYKLTDRWALTGEYNEFDEYTAGLKWRVFREKKDGDKPADAKP